MGFRSGKEVLIVSIAALVNGKSRFGVGSEGIKLEVGALIIDDVHACIPKLEGQFTLTLKSDHSLYNSLLSLFLESLKEQSITGLMEIRTGSAQHLMRVPFWTWLEKQTDLAALFLKFRDDPQVMWQWPLIQEDLSLCRCIFSADSVEISLPNIPLDRIPAYSAAKRRVFMSATLSDDTALATELEAAEGAVKSPITPKTASDLGDRMILVPQAISPAITDSDIRTFVAELAKIYNVVVLVPSFYRAGLWKSYATQIASERDLETAVSKLRTQQSGLTVIVNKYDGIDLPNDMCRVLVVDGLPDARRRVEKLQDVALNDTDRWRARQISRIEQGMGRGVRANDDYCAVILMGGLLVAQLYAFNAKQYFSPATAAQLALSEKVSAQLTGKRIDSLKEVIDYVLTRESRWVSVSKSALVGVRYKEEGSIDQIDADQRAAFDALRQNNVRSAENHLRAAILSSRNDVKLEGWLLQELAEAIQRVDATEAQKILGAALSKNRMVLKPLIAVSYARLSGPTLAQAQAVQTFLKNHYKDAPSLLIGTTALLSEIEYRPENAPEFEEALRQLGNHLGI